MQIDRLTDVKIYKNLDEAISASKSYDKKCDVKVDMENEKIS